MQKNKIKTYCESQNSSESSINVVKIRLNYIRRCSCNLSNFCENSSHENWNISIRLRTNQFSLCLRRKLSKINKSNFASWNWKKKSFKIASLLISHHTYRNFLNQFIIFRVATTSIIDAPFNAHEAKVKNSKKSIMEFYSSHFLREIGNFSLKAERGKTQDHFNFVAQELNKLNSFHIQNPFFLFIRFAHRYAKKWQEFLLLLQLRRSFEFFTLHSGMLSNGRWNNSSGAFVSWKILDLSYCLPLNIFYRRYDGTFGYLITNCWYVEMKKHMMSEKFRRLNEIQTRIVFSKEIWYHLVTRRDSISSYNN